MDKIAEIQTAFERWVKKATSRSLVYLEYLGVNITTIEKIKKYKRTYGFNSKRQFEFIIDFSTWLDDGSGPKDACMSIINSARSQGVDSIEAKVAASIYKALREGKTVSVGMEDWFDQKVVQMFKIGQDADVLPQVVSSYLEDEAEMKKIKSQFITALLKPLGFTIALILILGAIGQWAMPLAIEMKPIFQYPPLFIMLYEISTLLAAVLPYCSTFIIGTFIGYKHLRDNYIGPHRDKLNNYFPLSIFKALSAMTMLKNIAIMIKANQSLSQACNQLRREATPFMQYHYAKVIANCAKGDGSAAKLLDTGLLSPRLYERLENASNIQGEDAKTNAIAIAGKRSGEEAVKSLQVTKYVAVSVSWITTGLLLSILLLGMLGFMTSMSA